MVLVKVLSGLPQSYIANQKQPYESIRRTPVLWEAFRVQSKHNRTYAAHSFSWHGLGEGRRTKVRPGERAVSGCCGWYRSEEALPGHARDPGLHGGLAQQGAVGRESCTSTPLRGSPARAISESAWGDSGWKIAGLPEQLIHPPACSLLTPFTK